MRYTGFSSAPDSSQSHRNGLLWWLFSCVLFSSLVWASGFQVINVETHLQDGRYWLDASLDHQFSKAALDALESGVPLTIEVQIQVVRQRSWLWDELLVELQWRYRLEYHALARQYLITNQGTGELSSFPNLSAAQYFLGHLRRLPVMEAAASSSAQRLLGRLRTRLDIEALPAPLRPVAYLSPDWRLASEWYTWRL